MTELLKSTLASLLESFFYRRLMAQRRASPATVNEYRDAWRLFLLFVSERVGKPPCRLSLQELDRDVVLDFLDCLVRLERRVMAVSIDTASGFVAGPPRMLFEGSYAPTFSYPNYDVSPDGQRLPMLEPVSPQTDGAKQIVVVQNWFEELKGLIPTDN